MFTSGIMKKKIYRAIICELVRDFANGLFTYEFVEQVVRDLQQFKQVKRNRKYN